jgi:hypothetical protein
MKRLMLATVLVLLLVGCFGPDHGDLLRENRKHLVESVIPNYAKALQEACNADGGPLYILDYKHENVGVAGAMVLGIDRVLGDGPTEMGALPWQAEWDEREAERKAAKEAEAAAAAEGGGR